MRTLIIETSSKKPFFSFVEEKTFCCQELLATDKLALDLKDFLKGRKPDQIAVGIGPGSYTGMRVGGALAKALAFGWKVPLLGFESLLAFFPEAKEDSFAVVFDAKSGGVYLLEEKGPSQKVAVENVETFLGKKKKLYSPDFLALQEKYPLLKTSFQEAKPNPAFLMETLKTRPSPVSFCYL